jgi:hypothetical protein
MNDNGNYKVVRIIALLVIIVATFLSIQWTLSAGSRNRSVLLRAAFVIWVLFPFILLFVINWRLLQLSIPIRIKTIIITIVITTISLIIYSGTVIIPGTKNAFPFLVIPFLSLLIIIISLPVFRTFFSKTKKLEG